MALRLKNLEGSQVEKLETGEPDRIADIKRIIVFRNGNCRGSKTGLVLFPCLQTQWRERQFVFGLGIRRIVFWPSCKHSVAITRCRFPDPSDVANRGGGTPSVPPGLRGHTGPA